MKTEQVKNHNFQIEEYKINIGTKWERTEKMLTWWGKMGKETMPLFDDSNVEAIIVGIKNS